jgi:hypothetical protein
MRINSDMQISSRSVVIAKGNNEKLIEEYFLKKKWIILKEADIKFTRY